MKKSMRSGLLCALMIALVFFVGSSCKSLDNTTLNPKMKNEKLLPSLKPVFDEDSFSVMYGTYVRSNYMVRYSPSLDDIKKIYERDLPNICDFSGRAKGTIKCKAIDGKEEDRFWGNTSSAGCFFMFVTVGTLGISPLFGIPIQDTNSELQIEITIIDSNNYVVGRYKSDMHKQRTWQALYWGYNMDNAFRRNARLVFIACMEDIKRQINEDYYRLVKALQ